MQGRLRRLHREQRLRPSIAVRLGLALVAALALAAPASAHRSERLGLAHEIDHMVWDTNSLLREAGKAPFEVDLSYRALTDESELLAILELWSERFEEALKKSVWWKLARCESHGNWAMRGRHHGGFSFHPKTWAHYRPKGLPKFAYLATPGEQIRVARKVRADQGWEAWPRCAKKLGLLSEGRP